MKFTLRKNPSSPSRRMPAMERVSSLSQQGYSDTEIIRALRSEGYSPMEADMAMRQAVKSATTPMRPPSEWTPPRRAESRAPWEEESPRPMEAAQPSRPPSSQPPVRQRPPPRSPYDSQQEQEWEREPDFPSMPEIPRAEEEEFVPSVGKKPESGRTEEMVEGMVQEKWGMFEREMDEMNDRLEKIERRLDSLESSMGEYKGVKKGDMEQIHESMQGYKENIAEISQRIEGMERAVKDSMTPMMQSLRSLSDTLKTMKSRDT